MPPAEPELLARLEALRDELGRRKADAAFGDAAPELAERLDALFAAAYDSILADPPLAGTPAAGRRCRLRLPARAARGHARQQRRRRFVRHLFRQPVRRWLGAPRSTRRAGAAGRPGRPFDLPSEADGVAEADAGGALLDPAPPRAQAVDAPDAPAAAQLEPEPEIHAEPAPEPEPVLASEPLFVDELDPDLLPVFMEEASDLLPQIGKGLRLWQQIPADGAPAQGLLRALHTVKGSARMAGAMRLGQHTHALETQVENMLHAGTTSPAAFDELLANYDRAMLLFEQLQQPAAPAPTAQQASKPARLEAPTAPAAPAIDGQAAPAPLVRVRADILDRLVNQAGEVSITRSRLENEVGTLKTSLHDFADNVASLRRQLREIEMQAESQIASQPVDRRRARIRSARIRPLHPPAGIDPDDGRERQRRRLAARQPGAHGR